MAVDILNGLVSYYECLEAAGATRVDSQSINHCAEAGAGVPINQGTSLYANGTNSVNFTSNPATVEYLEATGPTNMDGGTGSFTVGLWVSWQTQGASMVGVSRYASTGDQRQFVLFYWSGSDTWRFDVSSDGADSNGVNDDEVWLSVQTPTRFVVGLYDGDNDILGIQVNNTSIVTAAGPATINTSTESFKIGNADIGGDTPLAGRAQGVFYYNRLLNTDELSWLYNSGSGRSFSEFTPAANFDAVPNQIIRRTVSAGKQSLILPGTSPKGMLSNNHPIVFRDALNIGTQIGMQSTILYKERRL